MPRRGENIFKRKDGRWEARYVKEITLDGKKKYGYITSVNEQLNGVWSYLKEYASDPDVRKEFHDSVCSISEVINKCVGLVNPETLSTSAIEDGEEGEES